MTKRSRDRPFARPASARGRRASARGPPRSRARSSAPLPSCGRRQRSASSSPTVALAPSGSGARDLDSVVRRSGSPRGRVDHSLTLAVDRVPRACDPGRPCRARDPAGRSGFLASGTAIASEERAAQGVSGRPSSSIRRAAASEQRVLWRPRPHLGTRAQVISRVRLSRPRPVRIIRERGLRTIVGFQTRNPITARRVLSIRSRSTTRC